VESLLFQIDLFSQQHVRLGLIALFTKIRVSFHVSGNLEQFLNVAGAVAVVWLGRLGVRHMTCGVVMAHGTR
jgi:hypothetical protein